MNRTIKLNISQLKVLLSDLFNQKNLDTVQADAILHMLTDAQIELLMHIMSTPDYKFLKRNQRVKFIPNKYDFDDVNIDILQDLGYVDKDGYHYGKVISDSSFAGSDFNPTSYMMKLECVTLENNKPKSRRVEVYTKNISTVYLDKWKGLE